MLVLSCITISISHAYAMPYDADAINPVLPTVIEQASDGSYIICPYYPGLVNRVVNCIGDTIIWSMWKFLRDYNTNFIITVNILILLAVMLYSVVLFTGRAQLAVREGTLLAIKIGVIIFLVNKNEFANLFPALIDTINFFSSKVQLYTERALGNYCTNALSTIRNFNIDMNNLSIWLRVDCMIEHLIGGILPNHTVATGILGFLFAAFFSGSVGVALFLLGISIILVLVRAFIQAVFTLLSAYLSMAMLAMIAPMVIPLILFKSTKAFFEKWLRLIIGVILQPIFLFAFLNMFLLAMDISLFTSKYSLYQTIMCNNDTHTQIGSFVQHRGMVLDRVNETAVASISIIQRPNARDARNYTYPNTIDSGMSGDRGLWDVRTGEYLQDFQGHQDEVLSVVFSSNNFDFASGSADKTVKL